MHLFLKKVLLWNSCALLYYIFMWLPSVQNDSVAMNHRKLKKYPKKTPKSFAACQLEPEKNHSKIPPPLFL